MTDPAVKMKARFLLLAISAVLGVLSCGKETPKAPLDDPFELNPSSAEIAADGGVVQIKVSGTRAFHVSSHPDWVSEPSVKDRLITLSAGNNDTGEERRGVVAVCDDSGACLSCLLTQKAPAVAPVLSNWDDPFPHKSLFFRFTATWCGWCPRMAASVKLAQEQNPDKLLLMNVHGYDSELEFSQVGKLMDLYKIDGYPSGIVDGRRLVQNYDSGTTAANIGKFIRETEDHYPTASRIAFHSELKARKLDIDLYLYFRYADAYKVTVVLLEDGVIAPQANFEGKAEPAYEHNDVLRIPVTNILGDAVVPGEDRVMEQRKYSVTIPQEYKPEKMKILVAVQRPFGEQEVLSGGYGSYYVDNCACDQAGADLPL